MSSSEQTVHHRQDYQPPHHLVETIDLEITLGEEVSQVKATLTIKDNPEMPAERQPLRLYGANQVLKSITIAGNVLTSEQYQQDEEGVLIHDCPESATIEIISENKPQENSLLMGLYKSDGIFCTQCESQGFRRITHYPDRPDVMTVFTTKIIADKQRYPVLLSNGNLIDSGELDDGRHFAQWHDPFKKPAHLFAMVAGDLAVIEDQFVTLSGREVALRIYAGHERIDQCHYAMEAVKKAMRWDEQTYSREYDLDIFMLVAIDDFNFGAMENKGLNIFNSQYILAKPETATDADYHAIDAVVAHEYFHNWSGNRVSLRDWFQITLKEGLTVFRDHSFSRSVSSDAVTRIDQVKRLRAFQFAEDAGPLAHPIRPDAYMEISNFYTTTVYEKGCEVIGMIKTALGEEGFFRGMNHYFAKFDGCAVTCDDFVAAMEEANSVDLTQFRLWYSQAGTPEVTINSTYDHAKQCYTLTVKQSCPATPGQPQKAPFYIPIKMGLLDSKGNTLPLQLEGDNSALSEDVLVLTGAEQQFTFTAITEQPTPSFLRQFSAPIKLHYDYSEAELAQLMAQDSDSFARWEAGQRYACNEIITLMITIENHQPLELNNHFATALTAVLTDKSLDKALIALMLTLPADRYLIELVGQVNIDALYQAKRFLTKALAEQFETQLLTCYHDNNKQSRYRYAPEAVAKRALKNCCLHYLVALEKAEYLDLAKQQFDQANSMTDQLAALRLLTWRHNSYRQEVLASFYQQWQHEPLVVNKWFAIQASSDLSDLLDEVRTLIDHSDFTLRNPNKVRALIGSYIDNLVHFHQPLGEGYRFLVDYIIKLDKLNPMVASRLANPLTQWRRYDEHRQQLMQEELTRLLKQKSISKDLYEVVSKSLPAH
ncbi:MAG: aminopeptidase N [Gammaproteobacteria bacterium]|nr:aminopeptidase N [Gammaproteobacteria bacterium]